MTKFFSLVMALFHPLNQLLEVSIEKENIPIGFLYDILTIFEPMFTYVAVINEYCKEHIQQNFNQMRVCDFFFFHFFVFATTSSCF